MTRLRFWLAVSDLLARLGLFGSRLYLWCVLRASDCVDWGTAGPPAAGESW